MAFDPNIPPLIKLTIHSILSTSIEDMPGRKAGFHALNLELTDHEKAENVGIFPMD